MFIGYARVSTQDQHLEAQEEALTQAGCERIYTDKVSGTRADRPGLAQALDVLRQGDSLVVWKLDRLGRSLSHLVQLANDLKSQGIGFKSLQENIDTTSGVGKLVFHLFASLAEFERDLIRERTQAGLASARARGKKGGRPKVMNAKKIILAKPCTRISRIPSKISAPPWGSARPPSIATSIAPRKPRSVGFSLSVHFYTILVGTRSRAMDACFESVNADVEIVTMRKNKAAPDGKTCLWSNVEGHPLFSNGIEFHLNPN